MCAVRKQTRFVALTTLILATGTVNTAATDWDFLGLTDTRVQTIELEDRCLYAGTFDGVYRLDLASSGATWDTLGLTDREIWALLVLSPDTLRNTQL